MQSAQEVKRRDLAVRRWILVVFRWP